jgi:GNAT superfamily N-acetyltransferase
MYSMGSIGAFTVRTATVDDADGVLQCLHSAFAAYQHHYTKAAFEDTTLTADSFSARLKEMTVLIAVDGSGRVVGTVACTVLRASEGHLRGMAVVPECQARGVASQLLAAAEAELLSRNCSRISLNTTEPLQPAVRFYERHGYHRSGKIGDFFGMPLIEYVKILP